MKDLGTRAGRGIDEEQRIDRLAPGRLEEGADAVPAWTLVGVGATSQDRVPQRRVDVLAVDQEVGPQSGIALRGLILARARHRRPTLLLADRAAPMIPLDGRTTTRPKAGSRQPIRQRRSATRLAARPIASPIPWSPVEWPASSTRWRSLPGQARWSSSAADDGVCRSSRPLTRAPGIVRQPVRSREQLVLGQPVVVGEEVGADAGPGELEGRVGPAAAQRTGSHGGGGPVPRGPAGGGVTVHSPGPDRRAGSGSPRRGRRRHPGRRVAPTSGTASHSAGYASARPPRYSQSISDRRPSAMPASTRPATRSGHRSAYDQPEHRSPRRPVHHPAVDPEVGPQRLQVAEQVRGGVGGQVDLGVAGVGPASPAAPLVERDDPEPLGVERTHQRRRRPRSWSAVEHEERHAGRRPPLGPGQVMAAPNVEHARDPRPRR